MKMNILIPLELSEKKELPVPLLKMLCTSRAILLGYVRLPSQTSPEEGREELRDKYEEQLSSIEDRLNSAGIEVVKRLVFTQKPKDTIKRICEEERCDVVLLSNPVMRVERALITVKDLKGARGLVFCISRLVEAGVGELTILHVIKKREGRKRATAMLEKVKRMLVEKNMKPGMLKTKIVASDDFLKEIIDIAADYDAVIMRGDRPTFWNTLFKDVSEKVAAKAKKPVIIINRKKYMD